MAGFFFTAHSSALLYSLLSVPVKSRNKMQPNVFLLLINVYYNVQLQLWFIKIKGYIREPLVLKATTLPLDQTYLTTSDTKLI